MSEIVRGKIGSVDEWDKIYGFHHFPLVTTGCSGPHITQGYVQDGCNKCQYIARLPKGYSIFGDFFCLLCFMETGKVHELGRGSSGRGSSLESIGCKGRFQRHRISPRKKKKLLGKFNLMLQQKKKEVDDFWAAKGLTFHNCCGTCDGLEPIFKDTYGDKRVRTCHGYCQDAVEKFGKRLDGKEKFCKRHVASSCDDWREVVPVDPRAETEEFYRVLNEIRAGKVEKLTRVLTKVRLLEAGKEALAERR